MGWTEMAEGWGQDETRTGTGAVRVFQNGFSSGSSVPPAMNEQHPSTSLQSLYVTSRRFSKINKSGTQKCVVTYAPFTDEQPNPNSTFANLPRRWRIGGEFINIEAGTPFYWKSNGDLVNQNTFRRIVNETYIVTEVVSTMAPASSSGKHANIIKAAGKCNSASWEGFGKGDWLYMGADIDEQYTSSGAVSYRIEHNFAARIITGSSEGWQRIYNETGGAWDQVSDQVGGFNEDGQLYGFTSFASIFSTT